MLSTREIYEVLRRRIVEAGGDRIGRRAVADSLGISESYLDCVLSRGKPITANLLRRLGMDDEAAAWEAKIDEAARRREDLRKRDSEGRKTPYAKRHHVGRVTAANRATSAGVPAAKPADVASAEIPIPEPLLQTSGPAPRPPRPYDHRKLVRESMRCERAAREYRAVLAQEVRSAVIDGDI